MHAVAIPPFERFYEEHRAEVLRLLRRRLGAERAEDAFQETFLRRSGRTGVSSMATISAPGAHDRPQRRTRRVPAEEADGELVEVGVEDPAPRTKRSPT